MENKVDILGVNVDIVNMAQARDAALGFMDSRDSRVVITPNSEIIYYASKNPGFCEAVNSADLIIPDGIGVVYAAKILGRPLSERVGGFDLLQELFAEMGKRGKTAYFLGSKPGVADAAAKMVAEKYGVKIVGTHDGYFTDEKPIIDEINALSPDLLTVCLGFPKQENFMRDNREKLSVGMMIGAGGSLDVLAGTAERAPEWYIKHNLEWFYRLKKQPSRIGRMMALPKFGIKVIFKGKRQKNA